MSGSQGGVGRGGGEEGEEESSEHLIPVMMIRASPILYEGHQVMYLIMESGRTNPAQACTIVVGIFQVYFRCKGYIQPLLLIPIYV